MNCLTDGQGEEAPSSVQMLRGLSDPSLFRREDIIAWRPDTNTTNSQSLHAVILLVFFILT